MWWHTVMHGLGKWRGNWLLEWVASTLHTTSEHSVSSITTADAHTSAASSRLNWRSPRRFKWTRPFRRKTKSVFCACDITFQLASTLCSISGFHLHVGNLWSLLGYYAACSGITSPTFPDNLSVPSPEFKVSWISLPLKLGPIFCSKTSVRDYHYMVINSPEERITHVVHHLNSLLMKLPRRKELSYT